MKLSDTVPKPSEVSISTPVHGGDQSDGLDFTKMTEFERDAALLSMIASLAIISEEHDERLQTLELA